MCRAVMALLAGAYVLALALLAVGTFGLFGAAPDPLAANPVALLGPPWNRLLDFAPERWWRWLTAAAPLANLALVQAICRLPLSRTV